MINSTLGGWAITILQMLPGLTNRQRALITRISLEWSEKILSCETLLNKTKTKRFIESLYSHSRYKKPEIIFVDSPLACQFAANKLAKFNILREYKNNYWNKALLSFENQTLSIPIDSLEYGRNNPLSIYRDLLWNVNRTYHQINRRVEEENIQFYEFSYHPSQFDLEIPAFYYFEMISILNNNKFRIFKDQITGTGIYDMILFEKFCIVCSMPVKIKRNEQNILHCENESAIEWKDGFGLYFLHGRCIPEKLIKAPGSITKKDIINEKNVEIRRYIMEKIGSERFSELLGLVEIDSDTDHQGNIQILYKTKEKDNLVNSCLYFARVICPSTGRKYYLSVPRMQNVWDAVAYTFNKDKESYRPVMET